MLGGQSLLGRWVASDLKYKSSHGSIASIHLNILKTSRLLFIVETTVTIRVKVVDEHATISLRKLGNSIIANRNI